MGTSTQCSLVCSAQGVSMVFCLDFGKSIGYRGSIAIMSKMSISIAKLRISLRFSLSRALHNDRAASFADYFFAPLFVSNFFTDNIYGVANFVNTGCARLDFQCVYSLFAGWVNMSYNSMMVEIRISFRPGQSHGYQHRNQSNLSNHDFFPRIEFEL